jgi:hypothetical protein
MPARVASDALIAVEKTHIFDANYFSAASLRHRIVPTILSATLRAAKKLNLDRAAPDPPRERTGGLVCPFSQDLPKQRRQWQKQGRIGFIGWRLGRCA